MAANFLRVDLVAILKSAREGADFEAQKTRGRGEQFVSWLFNQNFVARLSRRRKGEMIGQRCPNSRRDAVFFDSTMPRQPLLQRRVPVEAGASDLQLLEAHRQFAHR